jgi:hypothetical protein
LHCIDIDSRFRSSTDETSTCPEDRDQYQVQPHDDALEQTADSQEKAADVTAPKAVFMKPSSSPKKKMTEHEFVLVSSSGEPSSPKSHVSPNIPTLRFVCLTISSPRG